MMSVPGAELPDIDEVSRLASVNLPAHYVIRDIRVSYGSGPCGVAPDYFEIVIEYKNHIEKDLRGSLADIEAHQDWSHTLVQGIRSHWPSETIRTSFIERNPEGRGKDQMGNFYEQ
jgi:hypothetical protein